MIDGRLSADRIDLRQQGRGNLDERRRAESEPPQSRSSPAATPPPGPRAWSSVRTSVRSAHQRSCSRFCQSLNYVKSHPGTDLDDQQPSSRRRRAYAFSKSGATVSLVTTATFGWARCGSSSSMLPKPHSRYEWDRNGNRARPSEFPSFRQLLEQILENPCALIALRPDEICHLSVQRIAYGKAESVFNKGSATWKRHQACSCRGVFFDICG